MSEKHPLHLKNPELQTSDEVEAAVEKEERLTGESIPNDPSERIEAYLDRLENVFLNPDERVRERNLDMLREGIYNNLLIKKEDFPDSYFELQQRIARERGQAVEVIPDNVREQMMDTAIEDQRHSLDAWIEYLTSSDAVYPAWFKYYAFTQITKLSQFDKERGEFKKRTKSTVAPFPDIYREPLAQIADLYEKVKDDNKSLTNPEVKEAFSQKFPSLYSELIQESLAGQMEGKEEVRGEWVTYHQGDTDAAERLYTSLENKHTGWCTAGRSTAHTQVQSGDFHVYYTYDQSGTPTQPRIAIRMEGDHIGEVRGVLPHQGLEPIMEDVLSTKLQDFGNEAEAYTKKTADMKHLTAIEQMTKDHQPLTKSDLTFLYELDQKIEGFGYQEDPRIEELRSTRDPQEDMLTIFDCTPEQVAHNPNEVTEDTKAYVGEWNSDVFQTLKQKPNVTHLYESFPDKKIFAQKLETDPTINSPEKAEEKLKEKNIYLSDWGKDILSKTPFSHEGKTYDLVQFTVAQLGFPRGATTKEIYDEALSLGLELCPAEVGPHLRLSYPGRDYKVIAMEPISDRDGSPSVFSLDVYGDGLELDADDGRQGCRWNPSSGFVFLSRKST